MKADVSIVIPAYGAERFVGRALSSIAEQSCLPREVIVVDDGSIDDTLGVARAWRPPDGVSYRVLESGHQGAGAARNVGIDAAVGEWLTFLDADDVLLPESLGIRFGALASFPEADWIAGLFAWGDENARVTEQYTAARLSDAMPEFISAVGNTRPVCVRRPLQSLLRNCSLACGAVMVRRDAVRQVAARFGGTRTCEDWAFWLQLAATFDLVVCPEPVFVYRRHADNVTQSSTTPARDHRRNLQRLMLEKRFDGMNFDVGRAIADGFVAMARFDLARGHPRSALHSAVTAIRYSPVCLAAWKTTIRALLYRWGAA